MTNVIKVWADWGFRVQILSFRHGECFYPEEIREKVSFVELGTRAKLTTMVALWRHLRKVRPSVVLGTMHIANSIIARLAFLPDTGVRRLVSVPNSFGESRKRPARKQKKKLEEVRRLYPLTDGVIAISRGVRRSLVETVGLTGVPVYRIFNGSVTQESLERAKESPDHPWLVEGSPVPVVLTVGRLAPQKDQHRLIDAVAQLREERDVRLIIVGEGPLRDELEDRAASYGETEQWFSMPGFVDNPYAWMVRADCFVLCSLWEGFPNVLAEALGLGVPVVATDFPSGARDILDNGHYGYLVPLEDTEALKGAIRLVLDGDYPRFDATEAVAEFTAETASRRYLEVFGLA